MQPQSSDSGLAWDLCALEDLSRGEFLAWWIDLHGNNPPRSVRQDFLVRALAYSLEERALGGLMASEQKSMAALAEGKEGPRQNTIKSGTHLYREWHGATHEVVVSAIPQSWRVCACARGKFF